MPFENELPVFPSNRLNRFLCCLLFKIISPLFTFAIILSPTNEFPVNIPPVEKDGADIIAANTAAMAAIAVTHPTTGTLAAEDPASAAATFTSAVACAFLATVKASICGMAVATALAKLAPQLNQAAAPLPTLLVMELIIDPMVVKESA